VEKSLDEAFNWLVLILTVIAGALVQIPEEPMAKTIFARSLISPLLVLVGIWLWSYLAEKEEYQVILKSYAWFYASFLFLIYLFMFVFIAAPDIYRILFVRPGGGGAGLGVPLAILGFLIGPFSVYTLGIRPEYRITYKGSRILGSLRLLGLLYASALMTLFPLIMLLIGDFSQLYRLIYG